MEKLLSRYTPEQIKIIEAFFKKYGADNNKTGRINAGKKQGMLESWAVFPTNVVAISLDAYTKTIYPPEERKHKPKYVLGIMKNKLAQSGGGSNRRYNGYTNGNNEVAGDCRANPADGTAKTIRATEIADSELECDF